MMIYILANFNKRLKIQLQILSVLFFSALLLLLLLLIFLMNYFHKGNILFLDNASIILYSGSNSGVDGSLIGSQDQVSWRDVVEIFCKIFKTIVCFSQHILYLNESLKFCRCQFFQWNHSYIVSCRGAPQLGGLVPVL